jgi:hypothetical protein
MIYHEHKKKKLYKYISQFVLFTLFFSFSFSIGVDYKWRQITKKHNLKVEA